MRNVTRQNGFTLVELMVAVALLAIVVFYLLQTFTIQHRTYVVVDQVTEVQQNSRVIGSLVERDLRHAGFMVPEALSACGVDSTSGPDVLYVSDADAIDPNGQDPNLSANVSAGYDGSTGSELGLTVDDDRVDGVATYDTNGSGAVSSADGDFMPGSGAILTDLGNPARGTACGIVGSGGSHTLVNVTFASALGTLTPNPVNLRLVPAHVYTLSGTNLSRNGVLLATDVEDFQVAYFFDTNDDGSIASDGSEYPGSAAYASYGGGGATYSSSAWKADELREIRTNIVVRSSQQDPNQNYSEGRFQTTENRAAVTGSDRFRRRVQTSEVRLRNVGVRDSL